MLTLCQAKFGKTHLVLDLIEEKHNEHFNYIIIMYPTLRYDKTVIGRTLQDNKTVSEKVSGQYY